jgi:hypothetical protein
VFEVEARNIQRSTFNVQRSTFNMATATAARGPLTFLLQSASGQYLALGVGVYVLFPDQVKKALAPYVSPALLSQLGAGEYRGQQQQQQQHQPQSIIIQTPPSHVYHGGYSSGSSRKSLTTVLIYSVAGAGACWVGYIVCSQLLPDAVSEFMPVTKRLFKSTSETLGKGILQVKELLEDQIHQLLGQQQKLEQKQEDTHKSVKEVQSELGEARLDMVNLANSLDRCEAGLDHSNNMQGYTLRGIKLLVKCVTSFLPDESAFIDDISHFIEDGGGPTDVATQQQPPRRLNTHSTPTNRAGMGPSIMSRHHSSLPVAPLPHPNKVFGIGNANNSQDFSPFPDLEGGPSITSIDSLDDLSSKGGDGSSSMNHMGDIRALLGH